MKTPNKPNKLLDKLLKDKNLRNDAHLADDIGINKSRISEIRSGVRPVSAELQLRIMRKYKISLKEMDELLGEVKS